MSEVADAVETVEDLDQAAEAPATRPYRVYDAADLDQVTYRTVEGRTPHEALRALAGAEDGLPNGDYVVVNDNALRTLPVATETRRDVRIG